MSDTSDMLSRWLAERIADAVQAGRALGIAYPRDYEVGMRVVRRDDNRFTLRLRLDAIEREVELRFPTGRESSIEAYERAMKAASDAVHFAATKITHDWLDEHPEAMPPGFVPRSIEEAERVLADLPPPTFTRLR